MLKTLVTGGAGFIGSHVVDALVKEGHEVVIIDDLSTGKERNLNPKAKFYLMDIRDVNLSKVFAKEKPDYVDHHAAQMDVRRSVREPRFDAEVNIGGSINVIQCCLEHKVKKLIYISTGGAVYGEPQYLPVDEHHPVNPHSQYGISKHTVEHYLYLYAELYGLNYVVLRYPNVYGPRQDPFGEAGVTAIFVQKMLHNKRPSIFGDGEQLRDYTYVSDIVEANLLAIKTNGADGQIVNIGCKRGSSVNEIFKVLKELIDFKQEPIYEEPRLGEIHKIYISAELAKKLLGWEPKVQFEEGLAKLVDYFKSMKHEWSEKKE